MNLSTEKALLNIENLSVEFSTDEGTIRAVDGVSIKINKGQTLGVVGESGCGKSVTAMSIMQLIPSPPGKYVDGKIIYEDKNLLKSSPKMMQSLRGNRISMIFQEPMTSLNPVFTIGNQIIETLQLHQKLNKKQCQQKAIEMLDLVGIPAPKERINSYPHQLSGGMRQRVMIAMALSCRPDLLIADEPTTALDVTIQSQIMDLMNKLQKELGMSIMLITHDLGVVAETCDRVIVMYAGKVVEEASIKDIFHQPRHPYTLGLLNSIPGMNSTNKANRLETIPGMVPNLHNLKRGCRFQDRCNKATKQCQLAEPELEQFSSDHYARCFNPVPLNHIKKAKQ